MTLVIRPPQNYVPEDTYDSRYWMHRLPTPIWRDCYKGAHVGPTPFHVEVEGEIGHHTPHQAVWACSWCGYRYPAGLEPEAMSREWHDQLLQSAFEIEESVLDSLDSDVSLSALHFWGARIHVEDDEDE